MDINSIDKKATKRPFWMMPHHLPELNKEILYWIYNNSWSLGIEYHI